MTLDPSHPPSRSARRSPQRDCKVGAGRTQAASTAEQAFLERTQAYAEVERRRGSSGSSAGSAYHLDAASPDLAMEQVQAILGEGPTVTPQSAEDLL
ncbi:hypothetical protein NDU88_000067 [Pleurodeles waltl]|uniref:Uncharacterized protein n=1 Tax=Pleurodeles waltl TaxID=8319 RepID=A0AAV7KPR2_PLEWA|nr:hypothetical protein NDU88_000067 [Pleurodeles waltl]